MKPSPLATCMAALVATLIIGPLPALAEDGYPAKVIRIVVPYPAGGATDYVARSVGERLSKAVGQPVIVDNKAGAAGAIGASEVARARPDGYTLLMTITDSQINNTALYKSLTYRPEVDFVGISQIVRSPALISSHPATGIRSLADLQARIAEGKKQFSYASWGIGGLGHLAGGTLNRSLAADMVHVPQRGEGPVVNDLLSGSVDLGLSSVGSALQHVQAGTVVPLAILGRTRSTTLPDVPTMHELGHTDSLYDSNVWIGLLAPARTPQPIIDRLAQEVQAIVASPAFSQALVGRGFEVMNTSPAQFAVAYRDEFKVITDRIRELKIEPQ